MLWLLLLSSLVVSSSYSLSIHSYYRTHDSLSTIIRGSSRPCRLNSLQLQSKKTNKATTDDSVDTTKTMTIPESQLSSPKITKYLKQIDELNASLSNVKEEVMELEQEYNRLDKEYGSEIARVKKEFTRMKERAIEESMEIVSKAKVDALKEVLPINDNYYRAKGLYQNTEIENEREINRVYEDIFLSFGKVIEEFGVTRVESLGQPFDFNFMEAIMTAPSMDYDKDIVSVEYQGGYRMGQKCVRPAMVVVSTGPGPNPSK